MIVGVLGVVGHLFGMMAVLGLLLGLYQYGRANSDIAPKPSWKMVARTCLISGLLFMFGEAFVGLANWLA